MKLRTSLTRSFLMTVLFLLAGCASVGPHILPGNRINFNESLETSDADQILLNIVRMRYDDNPYFLSVSSITAGIRLKALMPTNFLFPPHESPISEISPEVDYEERPTITYTPLQGQEFITQMLTPIPLRNVYLLSGSGWDIERVLRITAQRIDDVPNAPNPSRTDTSYIPEYKEFLAFSRLLRKLHVDRDVLFEAAKCDANKNGNNNFCVNVIVQQPVKHHDEIQKLYAFLKLKGAPKKFKIMQTYEGDNRTIVPIITRSFEGVLFFLSKSVDVTKDDILNNRVVTPRYPDGRYFDWHEITQGLMVIHSSDFKPMHVAETVFYRNRWYYIDENDAASKETLALLEVLFYLQAGNYRGVSPALTVSV